MMIDELFLLLDVYLETSSINLFCFFLNNTTKIRGGGEKGGVIDSGSNSVMFPFVRCCPDAQLRCLVSSRESRI